MAEQVLIPEKRGGISGLMNMFSQGSSMLQMGAKGKEGLSSLMGSGGGGGGAGGLGGGAGAYSLGTKAFKPPSEGMSSELGGGEAAGGESASSFVGPAIALGMAGYGEYQAMKNPSLKEKFVGNRDVSQTGEKMGRGLSNSLKGVSGGLSLTDAGSQPNKMGALERRYESSRDPGTAIDEAQNALKEANLPDAERRSIYQKLELARQGGKRGSSVYT
jgi:hypothetical protein